MSGSGLKVPRRTLEEALRDLGAKAHADGIAFDACPYTHGDMRTGWQAGWRTAEENPQDTDGDDA